MEKCVLVDEQSVTIIENTEPIDSFENIYNRYAGKVYHKCLSMINDPEMAKDFTQDIFIKVFIKLNTFENRSAFSTWLYAVSHNYCVDYLRTNKRTEPLSDAVLRVATDSDLSEPIVAQWQALCLFMNNLPDEEAAILRLKYEQGLSVKLICERYNVSESSIKMRLKRSRDKLRALCKSAILANEKRLMQPIYA